MKKRIITYMKYIDNILADEKTEYDYDEIIKQHLIQLEFFMHERLVHLLVTLTFALLTFGAFAIMCFNFQPTLLMLLFIIMVLLVPYIMHYFLLENSVQKMYRQYDNLISKKANSINDNNKIMHFFLKVYKKKYLKKKCLSHEITKNY